MALSTVMLIMLVKCVRLYLFRAHIQEVPGHLTTSVLLLRTVQEQSYCYRACVILSVIVFHATSLFLFLHSLNSTIILDCLSIFIPT